MYWPNIIMGKPRFSINSIPPAQVLYARVTRPLLWQRGGHARLTGYSFAPLDKILGISWLKPFMIINGYVYTYCFLTVLALILLCGGDSPSAWFPSKVMLRFPTSCPSHNNMPQQLRIFLYNVIVTGWLDLTKSGFDAHSYYRRYGDFK